MPVTITSDGLALGVSSVDDLITDITGTVHKISVTWSNDIILTVEDSTEAKHYVFANASGTWSNPRVTYRASDLNEYSSICRGSFPNHYIGRFYPPHLARVDYLGRWKELIFDLSKLPGGPYPLSRVEYCPANGLYYLSCDKAFIELNLETSSYRILHTATSGITDYLVDPQGRWYTIPGFANRSLVNDSLLAQTSGSYTLNSCFYGLNETKERIYFTDSINLKVALDSNGLSDSQIKTLVSGFTSISCATIDPYDGSILIVADNKVVRVKFSTNITPVVSPISNLTATAGQEQITLNWRSRDAYAFYIERSIREEEGETPFFSHDYTTATSYTDTNLIHGITYRYRVVAVGNSGNFPASLSVAAKPLPVDSTIPTKNNGVGQYGIGDEEQVLLGTGVLYLDDVPVGFLKGDVVLSIIRDIKTFEAGNPLTARKRVVIRNAAHLLASYAQISPKKLRQLIGISGKDKFYYTTDPTPVEITSSLRKSNPGQGWTIWDKYVLLAERDNRRGWEVVKQADNLYQVSPPLSYESNLNGLELRIEGEGSPSGQVPSSAKSYARSGYEVVGWTSTNPNDWPDTQEVTAGSNSGVTWRIDLNTPIPIATGFHIKVTVVDGDWGFEVFGSDDPDAGHDGTLLHTSSSITGTTTLDVPFSTGHRYRYYFFVFANGAPGGTAQVSLEELDVTASYYLIGPEETKTYTLVALSEPSIETEQDWTITANGLLIDTGLYGQMGDGGWVVNRGGNIPVDITDSYSGFYPGAPPGDVSSDSFGQDDTIYSPSNVDDTSTQIAVFAPASITIDEVYTVNAENHDRVSSSSVDLVAVTIDKTCGPFDLIKHVYSDPNKVYIQNDTELVEHSLRFVHTEPDGAKVEVVFYKCTINQSLEVPFREEEFTYLQMVFSALMAPDVADNEALGYIWFNGFGATPEENTYQIDGNRPDWLDTDIYLREGQQLTFDASGQIWFDADPTQVAYPEGTYYPGSVPTPYNASAVYRNSTEESTCRVTNQPRYSLVGWILPEGQSPTSQTSSSNSFRIPRILNYTSPIKGKLWLAFNDQSATLADNVSYFTVKVTVEN